MTTYIYIHINKQKAVLYLAADKSLVPELRMEVMQCLNYSTQFSILL